MISDDDDGSETSYALVSPSTHERIEGLFSIRFVICITILHFLGSYIAKQCYLRPMYCYSSIKRSSTRVFFCWTYYCKYPVMFFFSFLFLKYSHKQMMIILVYGIRWLPRDGIMNGSGPNCSEISFDK